MFRKCVSVWLGVEEIHFFIFCRTVRFSVFVVALGFGLPGTLFVAGGDKPVSGGFKNGFLVWLESFCVIVQPFEAVCLNPLCVSFVLFVLFVWIC